MFDGKAEQIRLFAHQAYRGTGDGDRLRGNHLASNTAILFAALLSIVWLRMKPKDALTTFAGTLKDLALPIYSIGMVLALSLIHI